MRIESTENVAFMYVGSTTKTSNTVTLKWSPFVEPVVNPPTQPKSQGIYLASGIITAILTAVTLLA